MHIFTGKGDSHKDKNVTSVEATVDIYFIGDVKLII